MMRAGKVQRGEAMSKPRIQASFRNDAWKVKRGDGWVLFVSSADFPSWQALWAAVMTWFNGGPSPYPRDGIRD